MLFTRLKKMYCHCLLYILGLVFLNGLNGLPKHPLFGLKFVDIVKKHGYPVEQHTIVTEDGYMLNHHRVPHGKNSSTANPHSIIIVPGTSATSEGFVMLEEDESLAFVLADNGYDVWVLNVRGTYYSLGHKTLDSAKDTAFWDYSYYEIGYYDVTATIDYILNMTKKEKLTAIGHSQGSTCMFVTLSTRPEYNDKVNLEISFGPSAFLGNPKISILQFLARNADFLEYLVRDVLNIHFVPTARGMLEGINELCTLSDGFNGLCWIGVTTIDYGADLKKMFNASLMSVILSNMPGGVSTKNLFHYAQMYKSGEFKRYDYGLKGNLEHYNSTKPPLYNLTKISTTCALFYSRHDYILPFEGIQKLIKKLPHPLLYETVDFDFRHVTYIFSKHVKDIYPTLLPLLEKYRDN